MMIELFPAIDLHGGQVVRLTQGDYGSAIVYGSDPIAVASSFADAGASWIHVVDLDAARSGSPENRPVVAAIAAAVAGRARVQTGGGVRTLADAQQLADAGVARVVMGSAAVQHPELVEAAADVVDVAVGLITATVKSPHTGNRRCRCVPDEALVGIPRRARSSSPTSLATECSPAPTSRVSLPPRRMRSRR